MALRRPARRSPTGRTTPVTRSLRTAPQPVTDPPPGPPPCRHVPGPTSGNAPKGGRGRSVITPSAAGHGVSASLVLVRRAASRIQRPDFRHLQDIREVPKPKYLRVPNAPPAPGPTRRPALPAGRGPGTRKGRTMRIYDPAERIVYVHLAAQVQRRGTPPRMDDGVPDRLLGGYATSRPVRGCAGTPASRTPPLRWSRSPGHAAAIVVPIRGARRGRAARSAPRSRDPPDGPHGTEREPTRGVTP